MKLNLALLSRLATDVPMLRSETLQLWLEHPFDLENSDAVKAFMLATEKEEAAEKTVRTEDGFSVVPVSGPLAIRPSAIERMMYGMRDSRDVAQQIREAADDPTVRGIVLDIASPGGMHTGGPEMAMAARSASLRKPVVAYTDSQCCSLAYMLASQANEIVASPSASVGSIGAYLGFADVSKAMETAGVKMHVFTNKDGLFKAAGLPGTTLSADHAGYFQQRVEDAFSQFKRLVDGTRPAISKEAMRGQVFWAEGAKEAGLVDRIGDKHFALSVCRHLARNRK